MEKIDDYQHSVGQCYRCDTVIEPLVSKQWFVKMKPLAEPAIRVVKEGKVRFIPERFTKDLFQLDGKYQGLVYFPAAMVGPPYSGLVLPGLW